MINLDKEICLASMKNTTSYGIVKHLSAVYGFSHRMTRTNPLVKSFDYNIPMFHFQMVSLAYIFTTLCQVVGWTWNYDKETNTVNFSA